MKKPNHKKNFKEGIFVYNKKFAGEDFIIRVDKTKKSPVIIALLDDSSFSDTKKPIGRATCMKADVEKFDQTWGVALAMKRALKAAINPKLLEAKLKYEKLRQRSDYFAKEIDLHLQKKYPKNEEPKAAGRKSAVKKTTIKKKSTKKTKRSATATFRRISIS